MSKEKQMIEEMAWDLCDIPKHPSIKSCEECGSKNCHATYYAERAISKGYRKQSGWISVNDDTPKNELERVLVLLEDNDITHTIGTHKIDTDRFVNGKWARWGRWVTHWAPLSDTLKGE